MKVVYRWDTGPAHKILRIWVDGASIGKLTVRRGEEEAVLEAIVLALQTLPSVTFGIIDDNKH